MSNPKVTHQVVLRQCAIGWCPSASPAAAVRTASTRGLREKWGFLHCGTYVVACRDLPTPHLGWQLQPAREGEALAAALLRYGLFWLKVFSLSFLFLSKCLQCFVSLPVPHCSPVLPLALPQATKYLGSSGRSFMILSMQSRMRVRNQRLQPTAAAIHP